MGDVVISVAEAAKRLGITPRGVRKMIERGNLKADKVGRDWVINEKSLKRVDQWKSGRTS